MCLCLMRGRGIGHKLCPSPTLHTPHHTLISHKMCLLPPYLPPSVPVTALVEKLGQWAVTIGKDSSSSKMEKFIRNTFFQLCLCIFSTLITNVLFKKPFPLCAFSLKKSASISISLGYYESFRKKSFSNSDRAFFQLWSRGRVSKKYHAVLHFH